MSFSIDLTNRMTLKSFFSCLGRSLQDCAARILMRVRKYAHATPIMKTLHWLPVGTIDYKISLPPAHPCIYGNAPAYLKELLVTQTSARALRSGTASLLKVPRTKLYNCRLF